MADSESHSGPEVGAERVQDKQHTQVVHASHGHSVAAWTGVLLVMLGSLISSVAVLMGSVTLFVVGAIVVVLGGIAAKVLVTMGYGVDGSQGHD